MCVFPKSDTKQVKMQSVDYILLSLNHHNPLSAQPEGVAKSVQWGGGVQNTKKNRESYKNWPTTRPKNLAVHKEVNGSLGFFHRCDPVT